MIILQHHLISSHYPITASTLPKDIEAGMIVSFDTAGSIVANDRDSGTVTAQPVGFAGDKTRSSEAYEYENRVSDRGNETAGSGRMTVYHSGGEFWLDLDDSTLQTPLGTSIPGVVNDTAGNLVAGTLLYPSTSGGSGADDGKINTLQTGGDAAVALVVAAAQELESGIPGEYEPGSSFNLADDSNQRDWVKVKNLL